MPGQRSVAIEYLAIVLRAIERAQSDPTELRGLVYDVARFNLGTQALTGRHNISAAELQRHVLDLEIAIREAERLWRQEHHLPVAETDVRYLSAPDDSLDSPDRPADPAAVAVLEPPVEAEVEDATTRSEVIVVHDAPMDLYRETPALSGVLRRIEVWKPGFGSGGRGNWATPWLLAGLAAVGVVVVAFLSVAMYSALTMQLQKSKAPDFSYEDKLFRNPSAASASPGGKGQRLTAKALLASVNPGGTAAGFPLPKTYGVYALSDGRLYELSTLPIKVPDPRVAISAMISGPSAVTLPSGKLSFVVFRRDLVSSAPDEVSVRVVARVARDMKFDGTSTPLVNSVNGQWAIRSKSYELAVAPLGDNPEMIVIRPHDNGFSFPAGRYALVVKGQGYDFSVSGPLTDAAQCLERTEVVNGTVYSECRNLP